MGEKPQEAEVVTSQAVEEPQPKATTVAEPAPVETKEEAKEGEHGDDCTCFLCTVCNWIYDPKLGEPNQNVAPGTPWKDVPDWFLCPECGIGKEVFVEVK